MNILMIGDSWGTGAFDIKNFHDPSHPGLAYFLNQNHTVTNLSVRGGSNGIGIYLIENFLKEYPNLKTWIIMFLCFSFVIYIFYDSLQLGNFFGDILGLITALGLAVGAVTIRSARNKNLIPAAVVGKLFVALFALLFIESFTLVNHDIIIVPLMCIMCVAIPFVLVTIAPRFIPAAEVNLFFLLETIIGPIWVWLIIKEQPTLETIQGGAVIIATIAIHSFIKLKNS